MSTPFPTSEPQIPAPAADAAVYPAFLKLAGRKVVLVGAGQVASGKYAALKASGARLTIVAPWLSPALRAQGTDGVTIHERPFRAEDLDGAWYVVAAATPEVNRQVADAAEARRVFVNAVDDMASASAYAGAQVRRGPVTVAISTGGDAPALAGLLREAFDALLPDDLARWADEARRLRPAWKAAGVPLADRRPLLLEALLKLYADREATS